MSVVKSSSVFCDGPGPDDLDGCLQWVTETTGSAAAARRIAREYGWKRRGGKDLCPDCARKADRAMTDFGWLVEAEARAAAATPGPWITGVQPSTQGPNVYAGGDGESPWLEIATCFTAPEAIYHSRDWTQLQADAEFIAHARSDIERMLGALRAILDLCDDLEAKDAAAATHVLATAAERAYARRQFTTWVRAIVSGDDE